MSTTRWSRAAPALAAICLSACQQSTGGAQEGAPAEVPGDDSTRAYAGIGESETVRFTGTEPFWGGQVEGGTLVYSTPEDQQGTAIEVERFAGRNGISLSGIYQGADFTMAVTPGDCSDGMSDRTYPFTVTLEVTGEMRTGCAWTDSKRFTGPEAP